MILADENVHGYIISALRQSGYEVTHAGELYKGIKDRQVIDLALQHDHILLTEDKDFGEWVFAHHIRTLNVLFLRYSDEEFQEITQTLLQLLNTQKLERPFFATITTRKIRIRNL